VLYLFVVCYHVVPCARFEGCVGVCVWSVEQGVVGGCVVCVSCEVFLLFTVCFVRLLLSALQYLAHPLTTLLCLTALFVDDGARCVQYVSLPPSCVRCVCVRCVFVVCVFVACVWCVV